MFSDTYHYAFLRPHGSSSQTNCSHVISCAPCRLSGVHNFVHFASAMQTDVKSFQTSCYWLVSYMFVAADLMGSCKASLRSQALSMFLAAFKRLISDMTASAGFKSATIAWWVIASSQLVTSSRHSWCIIGQCILFDCRSIDAVIARCECSCRNAVLSELLNVFSLLLYDSSPLLFLRS